MLSLPRLHHKERWLAYLDSMLASHTVRQAASRIGVHRNTSPMVPSHPRAGPD